ncbi:3-hydroxybutyryl-CoA dehydratase [Neorhizobium galegae bv. officinalis bv. officinalis str. HAMBI 1141]|uniref:3-hydroxybutyryl-CoA dehydratase n=1 Tax=Neorhizobium galegae bv. officinalis bv. officinalis str. HAMBI 1141 TaxID=1028801 RepID=A0A068TC58_NEOGA|nr:MULTISPECIES: enoyl-CoA hydratase/isomerase family protein [Neorhizobium]MCJ9672557.1 enoyl-CoA hydratase/isomerase family protein [Neorhizobium sp. SHOUNA12B]MCJ9742989.1 enoyl-CoA hydratase/isomerase family protein [Neorhizobium sp. SHOUNA12A]MCJ9750259.1 enoyl-CoA hydratase/isomerase family protein [Neorhizobium sp. BETTINA12A]CDN55646.1 3-hydroxybutyryl-CoA dehydratase [Neorhizobium galegae bv. officinalis bv. officinalis str. HAMBI 1141]
MNQQMNGYETILYEKDLTDKFATITINRPDKMNAMNKTVIREIDAAVAAAVADPDVNALVITGTGRAFSSGYDLQGGDFDVDIDFWREDMSENAEALLNIWRAPIPVIASVNGYALAGALELMMCCDLAIAADNAKFGEPEVRHNSGPPALMMPWLLATRDVRWLMFTGDMVDAQEALRMHLINKVVPADQLKEKTENLARKLARMPVPALRYTKASINNQQMVAGLMPSFQYNIEAIAALHVTRQGREWMANLAKMSLKEYLAFRDDPFKGLD